MREADLMADLSTRPLPASTGVPKRAVRRHWLLRAGLATLLFTLAFGVQVLFAEEITALWVWVVQPLVPADAQTVDIAGRHLRVPYPVLNVLLTLGAASHLMGLPLLISLWTYHRLTPPVLRLDGHTRCGACGYILKGLREPRCPECGRSV